jgi:hypothetical protein
MVRVLAPAALLVLTVGCSYETGAVFNADGTVTVSAGFLFPKSLMTASAGSGGVSGMSASDIKKANSTLSGKYPGAKVELITKGEEQGAKITIPFKNEKDAFNYLTQPSKLDPSATTSGSSGIDLSNTGGLFQTANHSSNTYTFTTKPPPPATPDPNNPLSGADVLDSLFSVTFSLTVPSEITSASGALFTADHKTAIWKISLVTPMVLTATTGSASSAGPLSPLLLVGIGLVAGGLGFVLGLFMPWRRFGSGAAGEPHAPGSPPAYTPPPPPPG